MYSTEPLPSANSVDAFSKCSRLHMPIVVFIWTIRNAQYDDMEGPAYRILSDGDERPMPERRTFRPNSSKNWAATRAGC